MPEKIAAKYVAKNGEHHMGLPARDIGEEEFDRLSDEHKALMAASSFYQLRHEAPREAEKAARRVERAEPAPTVLESQAVAEMPPAPASKDGGKK